MYDNSLLNFLFFRITNKRKTEKETDIWFLIIFTFIWFLTLFQDKVDILSERKNELKAKVTEAIDDATRAKDELK